MAIDSSTDLPSPIIQRGFVYAVWASKIALRSLPRSWNFADRAIAFLKSPDSKCFLTCDNFVSMMFSFDAAQYIGGAHGEIGDWELFFKKLSECA